MRGEKIMPSTQNAVNNHEYRSVPITALAESATNPRKRFNEKSLEELAASFKTQGILAPLLVRELEESKYEVVAGARRLRAAKLAELEKLPVRVVKLTDAEAIEAQCVELSIAVKHFLRSKQLSPSFTCERRAENLDFIRH
jgi:ParB-like chromosome segregation protein Spo0J